MEQKKSKVKKVVFQKEWENEYGKFYSFGIRMENNDAGYYNSKSKDQDKFVEGQEVEYEYEPPKEGKTYGKIKPVSKPKSSGRGFSPQRSKEDEIEINRDKSKYFAISHLAETMANIPSYAARYAADIVKDKGEAEKKDFSSLYKTITKEMLETMDEIMDKVDKYLNDK